MPIIFLRRFSLALLVIAATAGASPRLLSVSFWDTTGNGRIDRLILRFSEVTTPDWGTLAFLPDSAFNWIVPDSARPLTGSPDSIWFQSLREDSMPRRTNHFPAVSRLTDSQGSSLLSGTVDYIDRAPPALVTFYILPSICGSNLARDRLTVKFSEPVWVLDSTFHELAWGMQPGFICQLFRVDGLSGVAQTNVCQNNSLLLNAINIDEVQWQNGTDSLTIDLKPAAAACDSFIPSYSRLTMIPGEIFSLYDSARNMPVFSTYSPNINCISLGWQPGDWRYAVCQVTSPNIGSVSCVASAVTRDSTGTVNFTNSNYQGLAFVEVSSVPDSFLFAPIDGSPFTDVSRDTNQLRQLLLLQSLGFFADIIVLNSAGDTVYTVTNRILPTDFVAAPTGTSLENKIDTFLTAGMYQNNVDYGWQTLNGDAKNKLLAWDCRDNAGNPVPPGTYSMIVYFRNAGVSPGDSTGRRLIGQVSVLVGPQIKVEAASQPKATFSLSPTQPNPFNPSTVISYSLPGRSRARLQIFAPNGRLVTTLVDAVQPAGTHSAAWEGRSQPAGIYFIRLSSPAGTRLKRAILVK